MANFEISFERTMKWEGWAIENVEHDKGGETCNGIARNLHPDWHGWVLIDEMKKIGKVDPKHNAIVSLTKVFYENTYGSLNKINDQKIADQIYQGYINCGRIGKKWGQMVANGLLDISLVVDGIIGMQSLSALNRLTASVFCKPYHDMQVAYYEAIVARDTTQEKFLRGWKMRADDFL